MRNLANNHARNSTQLNHERDCHCSLKNSNDRVTVVSASSPLPQSPES